MRAWRSASLAREQLQRIVPPPPHGGEVAFPHAAFAAPAAAAGGFLWRLSKPLYTFGPKAGLDLMQDLAGREGIGDGRQWHPSILAASPWPRVPRGHPAPCPARRRRA